MSIQKKVVIAILIAGFMALAIGMFVTYYLVRNVHRETIGRNFAEIAQNTSERFDATLKKEIAKLQLLFTYSQVFVDAVKGNSREDIEGYLQEYFMQVEEKEEHTGFLVVNEKGRVIGSGMSSPDYSADHSSDQSNELWWKVSYSDGKGAVYVSNIYIDKLTGNRELDIGLPVVDSVTGMVVGGIRSIMNVDVFFRFISEMSFGRTGHGMLVDSKGTPLICSILPLREHSMNQPLIDLITSTSSGWAIAGDDAHGGRESIIGFSPVEYINSLGAENRGKHKWYTFIRQDPAETYAPMYTFLWRESILGFSLVGFISLLGFYMARRVAGPIKVLSEGANLIGQGRLDHTLRIKTGDEIEELADIINRMAKDLEKRFEEIRLERDKLNTVMNSIGDGLAILDNDLRIEYLNAKFLSMYGEASIGKHCYEVFGIEGKQCEGCSIRKREQVQSHSSEIVTADGQTYLVTHSPVGNLDGTVSIVGIYKDITKRKRLEQQVLHSERLAALSQFSSSFAHDLRNPIIAIKKTLEMLKDSSGRAHDEATKRIYSDLISTCGLLLGLVNNILDVHQVRYRDLPLLYSSFSLYQALKEVIRLFSIEIEERKISVEIIKRRDKDIFMDGDRRRLQRVFINLLSNAIKYSPRGGKVTIFFDRSISSAATGTGDLLFRIEDEGPGILPADLLKVFELFYRAENSSIKSGTGLGLYFSKVVVEAHGGKIWVENREGGGAIFHIRMPIERRSTDVDQDPYS